MYYGLLNIQELPTELRIKSQLLNGPKRPSADSFALLWSLPPPHSASPHSVPLSHHRPHECPAFAPSVILSASTVLLDPLPSTPFPN